MCVQLSLGRAHRFVSDTRVAWSRFKLAYHIGVKRLLDGMSALQFKRHWLDRLNIGKDLTHIPWGSKRFKLPPANG